MCCLFAAAGKTAGKRLAWKELSPNGGRQKMTADIP
jgi:hypothetical protein